MIKLSLVIPAKDANDPKLHELLRSVECQDFPKDELEILVITEGTSESAKAIGIRRAKGEVIGILASDNELILPEALGDFYERASRGGISYPTHYYYSPDDNALNRYFSLIGGNDPLAYYLNKNDRCSHIQDWPNGWFGKTLGDNGFFIRKSMIEETDLDNYYHIDNANEAIVTIPDLSSHFILHKTGGNIFSFFAKRYRYGLQHAFNNNRRWHLVDFRKPQDIWRLIWFVTASFTIIHPLILSTRGYLKIRDKAWFLHPVVCLMTVFTYTALVLHIGLRRLTQSLSAPMAAQRA